jgi:hypothetical protein
MRKLFAIPLLLLVMITSCKKSTPEEPIVPSGKLTFSVDHTIGSDRLVFNQFLYTNEAGNEYLVSGLKYFLSDITLYHDQGSALVLDDWKSIFYIDESLPETKIIRFYDKIPAGVYDSVSLIFGITGEKNQSFMFVNPPEALMVWPDVLGGGYHYMMLDGKWKNPYGIAQPFNFHMGIGQLYKGSSYDIDSIYAFVQNWFRVSLPGSGFEIGDGEEVTLGLTMHIDNWFKDPYIYDHNFWGGAIMQKQPAMEMARLNGWNVFSARKIITVSKSR